MATDFGSGATPSDLSVVAPPDVAVASHGDRLSDSGSSGIDNGLPTDRLSAEQIQRGCSDFGEETRQVLNTKLYEVLRIGAAVGIQSDGHAQYELPLSADKLRDLSARILEDRQRLGDEFDNGHGDHARQQLSTIQGQMLQSISRFDRRQPAALDDAVTSLRHEIGSRTAIVNGLIDGDYGAHDEFAARCSVHPD